MVINIATPIIDDNKFVSPKTLNIQLQNLISNIKCIIAINSEKMKKYTNLSK